MSFCIKPSVCKKCGKPLTLFEGWHCLECEKAEQDIPIMYYPQVDGITPTVVKAEQEPCDDTISREDAIKALDAKSDEFPEFGEAIYILENLPSVKSQELTSPCDLCRFDYMDGVCGDCHAMAKAEWE